MPNVRWSRAINVPCRDLPTIVGLLSDLARRECPGVGAEIDYTADIDVCDTDTGALVVWTATFAVATAVEHEVRAIGLMVFRDFTEQLGRELPSAPVTFEQAS